MVNQANVNGEVAEAFAGVTSKNLRFAICKVEGAEVQLVGTGARAEGLEELRGQLGDIPCYVVYDFEHTKADSSTMCKTCFINYSPDSCTSMQMKFALQNYKASVMSKINSQKEMQINDLADLTQNEFLDAFNLN